MFSIGLLLRSFQSRRKWKVDPDGVQFLQEFFNAIGEVVHDDLRLVLPAEFRAPAGFHPLAAFDQSIIIPCVALGSTTLGAMALRLVLAC